MYYYKQMQFTVFYVDEYGDDRKTYLKADDDSHAQEKAESLADRYDWQKIKEIRRS